MKRRGLFAVLPVLAIAVAAGTGEATLAAPGADGGTQGQPWTGSQGVTESVATLNARQRAEDRRRGGRPLGIQEQPQPGTAREKPKIQPRAPPQQRTGAAALGPHSSF